MQRLIGSLILAGVLVTATTVGAQDNTATKKDTVELLHEVVVHAYANDRRLQEVPAAIGYVDAKAFERFNNTSLLSAVNTVPGVRMEERSPGSYRFAIRGSSLRSPFGVRNVKMYWNGLPLTDGGGNTYLNLVDFNSVASAEIIKGPGGSLFGAGTGGVVLLRSPISSQRKVQISTVAGSYGLFRYQISAQGGTENLSVAANYAHMQSNGYRQQTRMARDAFNTDLRFRISKSGTLSASIFYTDLYYQTPGGLTQAQFDADPKQARAIAITQKATVYNKTFYSGVMYQHQWNDSWSTQIGVYGSSTNFINPTVNNYEKRKEDNWGGRTETQYEFGKPSWKGKITFGGEYQHFYSPLTDYDNAQGVAGNVQTDDRLGSDFLLLFAQAEIDLPRDFYLTLGGSGSFLNYTFNRLSVSPSVSQERHFNPVLSPRIALLKKIREGLSVYGNVSKGYSPPSLAEVRPSTGNYNNSLNPETGISYEAGIRGSLGNHFGWDIAAYDFELDQTIVVQQINNADYFINSGRTSQKGIETQFYWTPIINRSGWLNYLKGWTTFTFNDYKFKNYVKNATDFSGNKLTGVAPNVFVGGIDGQLVKIVYFNITVSFVDKTPLNDGNTQYAGSYWLAGGRLGMRTPIWKNISIDIFTGVDNATNKHYSLGNDLNAAGGRYYNAAAGTNFYGGVKLLF